VAPRRLEENAMSRMLLAALIGTGVLAASAVPASAQSTLAAPATRATKSSPKKRAPKAEAKPEVTAIEGRVEAPAEDAERPARRSVPVNRCVKFSQSSPGGSGLLLRLTNECSAAVTCSLSWRVTCHAKADLGGRQSTRLALEPGSDDVVLVEVDACAGRGWDVGGIRWTCEEAARPDK
jgi:hypothetical protein